MQVKQAETPLDQQALNNERVAVLANILRFSAGAGLLGAGLGGANQLYRTMRAPDLSAGPPDAAMQDHTLPYPTLGRPKKKRTLLGFGKTAQIVTPTTKPPADDIFSSGAKSLIEAGRNLFPARPTPGVPGVPAPGLWATSKHLMEQHPWALPTALVAAPAAAYAGYGLGSMPGKALRKREEAQELDDAAREYEEALLGQYQQPLKKRAFLDFPAAGAYAAYAVPTMVGAGLLGYNRNKINSQAVIQAALRRRAMMQAMESPPEMHLTAIGKPVGTPAPVEKTEKREKKREED
jgi:hypothetical protein